MKRIISLALALLMTLSLLTAGALSVDAADGFSEGDVIWLQISNPYEWAQNSILYANFTAYSRMDNNNQSVILASADREKYHPVTGVETVENNTLYKYTVTKADAGAQVMRFWRGNEEKLWNSTVSITAEEYRKGVNTIVVTDWTDSGFLTMRFDYDLKATLSLSSEKIDSGETVDITLTLDTPVEGVSLAYSIQDGSTELSASSKASFTPQTNGVYTIYGVISATDENGKTVGIATDTKTLTVGSYAFTSATADSLYVYAGATGTDTEAWVACDSLRSGGYAFFLPSSIKESDELTIYNTFSETVTIGDVTIKPLSTAKIKAQAKRAYAAKVGSRSASLTFNFSTAEAALWVNNPDSFSGMGLMDYLTSSKDHSAAATGAFSAADGTVELSEIKKIKGRGNTSWNADKKGFNVTFKSAVAIDGMPKTKKFSLVSNFQDATLSRNRILFDMADEVGVPYASDSRFIDFYVNGVYQGAYQLCQKIDAGKNNLIDDVDEEDYLNTETGGVKTDFSFVCEIDPAPSDDDFHFSVNSGVNLTVKSPELDTTDANIASVRGYIKNRYNTMWSKLTTNASDLDDYIDVNSLAKVYLINELGKNWDSGSGSFFFVYKPDRNGKYKFFASPVWDYDNSLGNANGVSSDLNRLGITDYTLPTGWFSTKKGGTNSNNILNKAAKQSVVMEEVYRVWFEDFLPAIDKLNGKGDTSPYLCSADIYESRLIGSAEMNYQVWDMIVDTSWIANHSSLKKLYADYTKNQYGQITGAALRQDASATSYDQYSFTDEFRYMLDWLNSRAAWISSEYIAHYTPSQPPTEPPTQPPTEAPTEPKPDIDLKDAVAAWIFDSEGKLEGEKLIEYGTADDGYRATLGFGTLTLSVDGEKKRALEWSAPEYGATSTAMVPIMAAGSKNLWGSPYLLFEIPAKGYERFSFTASLAGSKKCPASWQLSYSTDGERFTPLADAVATITSDNRKLLTAYFDKTALPSSVKGDTLYLKLTPVSMTTVSGGDTADAPSGGELALNYIVVKGQKTEGSYKKGDVDLDGVVSVLDATAIQKSLASLLTLTDQQKALADTDGDGFVSVLDATRIQKWLASIIPDL